MNCHIIIIIHTLIFKVTDILLTKILYTYIKMKNFDFIMLPDYINKYDHIK